MGSRRCPEAKSCNVKEVIHSIQLLLSESILKKEICYNKRVLTLPPKDGPVNVTLNEDVGL